MASRRVLGTSLRGTFVPLAVNVILSSAFAYRSPQPLGSGPGLFVGRSGLGQVEQVGFVLSCEVIADSA